MNSWIDREEWRRTGKEPARDEDSRVEFFDRYEYTFNEWVKRVSEMDESNAFSEIEDLHINSNEKEDVLQFIKDVHTNGW